jgi:hypothetical protein
MVFITQTDIFGHGLPIYTINRHFEEIEDLFDDGSHIIYVNGSYKGDDAIGRMIHDFGCKDSKDIYYPELAKGVKHFKEEGGRKIMCEAVERYAEKRVEESKREERLNTIRKMMQKNYSKEQILDIGFTAEEYTQAEASMLATV